MGNLTTTPRLALIPMEEEEEEVNSIYDAYTMPQYN
jgi:hypothetical protein